MVALPIIDRRGSRSYDQGVSSVEARTYAFFSSQPRTVDVSKTGFATARRRGAATGGRATVRTRKGAIAREDMEQLVADTGARNGYSASSVRPGECSASG